MKVSSIVLNNFTNDNRVLKENLSFVKAGFEPQIIAMHDGELAENETIQGITIKRIKLTTKNLPSNLFFSAVKYLEFAYKAFRFCKESDTIHCNDLDTLPIGYIRKLFSKNKKLVYDAHEFELFRTGVTNSIQLSLNKFLERLCIKKADAVLTVSDSIADAYSKMYDIERPFLIYNCPKKQHPILKKNDLFRAKYQLGANQKIYIYQGALTLGRGIEKIVEAFHQLNNEFVVVFMGYGPLQEVVKNAAEKSNNIFFHPAVPMEEISSYSNSADWGLITIENISKSYNFSLPNKMFEYCMAEIPVIAFPTFEIKNKIDSYGIGFVANNESAEELLATIKSTKDIKPSIFNDGLKKMAKTYNWENQEKKLIEIYSNL